MASPAVPAVPPAIPAIPTVPPAIPAPSAGPPASSSARVITIGAVQFSCVNDHDIDANCNRAEARIRDAARKGANIILLPELFASSYFPIDQIDCLRLAISITEDKSYIARFQALARELSVVLPISFYERSNNAYFNSIVIIDADGSQIGVYRKAHIPDGPGYQEKFYFSPGDTGFCIYKTRFAIIGVGICSDQWYPEAARVMALQGAEVLLYPTAIGSEPQDPALDTCGHWQRCMQGHAAANMVPVIAANRVGKEIAATNDLSITFYGSSFMTDHTGAIVSDAGRHQEIVLTHMYNLDEIRQSRHRCGFYRDRRPDLYSLLCSFDGHIAHVMPHDRRISLHRLSNPNLPMGPNAALSPPPPAAHAAHAALHPAAFAPPAVPPRVSMVQSPAPTPSTTPTAVTIGGALGPSVTKKEAEPTLVASHTMVPVVDETQRRVVSNTFDLHEASFIGEVKGNSQRRPRGRCWVCRAKTTYECKLCPPGPVPLCNRTARECWWKYHAGEITPYVPNKRGRKRRKIDGSLQTDVQVGNGPGGDTSGNVGVPQDGGTEAAVVAAAAAAAAAVGVQPHVGASGEVGEVGSGGSGDVDVDGVGDNESDDGVDDKSQQQQNQPQDNDNSGVVDVAVGGLLG